MKCLFPVALLGLLLCALNGCSIIGVAAHALPPPTVPASYKNLPGHTVAVMVSVDRAIQIDFPSIQLDLASAIQSKLKVAQKADKPAELKDTKWTIDPRSVVKYQQDHPDVEAMPVTSVAPALGAERVIFVEIENFQTRSEASIELFRGVATATLKVVEVDGPNAKTVYEENTIRAASPQKPVEGIPNSTDYKTYLATMDELSTQIAVRFFPHPQDEE